MEESLPNSDVTEARLAQQQDASLRIDTTAAASAAASASASASASGGAGSSSSSAASRAIKHAWARGTPEHLAADRARLWHPYTSMVAPNAALPVASADGVRLTLEVRAQSQSPSQSLESESEPRVRVRVRGGRGSIIAIVIVIVRL